MNKNEYTKAVKKLGKMNFRLAVEWGRGDAVPETIADALRLMESRKDGKRYPTKKAQREAAEMLRDTAASVFWSRSYVCRGRLQEWNGRKGKRSSILGTDMPAILPNGTLRERAEKRVKRTVESWMARNTPAFSGDTEDRVTIGEASAETLTDREEQYSRKCTYHKTNATHCVTVPADYWRKVIRRGMVDVDGLLTLDLEPITHDSRTVYAAKWARVCGKRLKMESGYIAVDGDETAHAKTPQGACAILTRRENEARYSRLSRKIREKLKSMRLNGYAKIEVTLADSYRAGNCKPGTLDFRDKHFPNRDSVTIEELLKVESQRGLAINAALQAIRRANARLAP